MKDQCYIIRLDGRCNERCLFCMESENISSARVIEFEDVAREILSAYKNGYNRIDFYGGEPTTYDFLKKAIYLCNKLRLNVTLATNGLKFHDRIYAYNFFSNISIYGIRTSLHSHKADVHDRITCVRGSWEKTIQGIRNILDFNKSLTLNVVITQYNYSDLLEIENFVKRLGIKGIKYSGIVFSGDAKKNSHLYVDQKEYSKLLIKSLIQAVSDGFTYIEIEKMPKEILETIPEKIRSRIKFVDEVEDKVRFIPIKIKKENR